MKILLIPFTCLALLFSPVTRGNAQPNTPPTFSCGPNQVVNEDAGARSVAGWATRIRNHSITNVVSTVFFYDFGSLPVGTRLIDPNGSGSRPNPRVEDGILKLTDALDAGGFGGWAIGPFPVALYDSLSVHWKSRVGGGGNGGAHGYSLNIGTNLSDSFAGEEGTGTGLIVTVDTLDNGNGQDVGVEIKWRGSRAAYIPLPKDNNGSGNYIRKDTFVDASLTVSPAGAATVVYDGNTVTVALAGYNGIPANQVLLGARTASANDNHWIDDLNIVSHVFDASAESGQTVSFIVTNDNPGLFNQQPVIRPDGTLTYRAVANASGVANVTVVAMDNGGTANGGNDTSAPCSFTITVTPVCDPISATNDRAGTIASAPVTIAVLANDSDIEGGLAVSSVTQGANGTVAISGNNVTYTPNAGYNGTDTFTYTAVNNCGSQATATVTVENAQSNTPPSFACGPNQAVNEDAGAQTVARWATDIKNHGIARMPTVFASDFSSLPAGTRLIDLNGAGTRSDPRVEDGILKLTDAGDFVGFGGWAIGPFPVALYESLSVHWKSRVGGGVNGGADGYSLNIGTNLSDTFIGEEGTGTGLSVTVDTFDNGSSTDVGVEIKWRGTRAAYIPLPKDNDGSGNYIRKNAFVDASLTVSTAGVATVVYDGNTATVALAGYNGIPTDQVLLGARTGDANDNHWIDDLNFTGVPFDKSWVEAAQTVSFIVNNDNASLFSAQPAISADGTLTYTPAPNASGVANVTVVAMDNGGTANGGNDTSAPCRFTITVTAANNGPVLVSPTFAAGQFSVSVSTVTGKTYVLEANSDLSAAGWVPAAQMEGDGSVKTLTHTNPSGAYQFYRLRVE